MEAFDSSKISEMFNKLQFMPIKQAEKILASDPNVASFSVDYETGTVSLELTKTAEDAIYTESYKRYRHLKGLYDKPNEEIHITVTIKS